MKYVIMKPKMTLLEMQENVLQRFSVSVSVGQCQRVRDIAMGIIEGKLEDHYAKVWEYATAIRLSNPDNHVYPIAWEVLNVENKDNWTWFIKNLVADLDLGAGNELVVILEQHKGLLQTVADLLPHVEHRESVENGVAECFNGMINEIRKKPLLKMLEEIRILLMKRFFHQGQEVAKWRGNYGPNIQLKLDEYGKDMSPMKRTEMMARRGGKAKVSGSRNKTPKKTPNGKKHKSEAKENVSITCDEYFDDLFTNTPNGKQPMSQEKEDVQE
uniref:Uncharacterized protein n=1 Tax=Lactuca sativa TaxID=4236 RepID=A0A9R1W6S3_LACSA|nr:hypothetical protein LSAT_V11C300127530 [Lactuca sativa]